MQAIKISQHPRINLVNLALEATTGNAIGLYTNSTCTSLLILFQQKCAEIVQIGAAAANHR